MCFSFYHLFWVLLICQGCFHWCICKDCSSSFLSSVYCSFPASSLRKMTDKFRSQGRASRRICFSRCSFGRTLFRRINSWSVSWCPYLFATMDHNHFIRCLHSCYTSFIHVPHITWPNPQMIKHFFKIIKNELTVVLLTLETLLMFVASGL